MNEKTIYLAGGCFWGCQKYFDLIPGVLETEVGYANGPTANPSYQQVKAHAGHAETVRVRYDADALPLEKLLDDVIEHPEHNERQQLLRMVREMEGLDG